LASLHFDWGHGMTRFILASGSPRRRELFALFNLPFDIASADVDETPHDGEAPDKMVARLSQAKVSAVARLLAMPDGAVIIAADTTVSLDAVPLGKPADGADARRMLRALRGRTHQVHTALTLLDIQTSQSLTDVATTDVPMREYGDDEVAAYIASGDALDKAGAYAIQHNGFHPVAEMRGCFANVMGLPLCHLARTLRAFGQKSPADIPVACQSHIGYHCPVFADILASITVADASPCASSGHREALYHTFEGATP
jgi:septum formation protein